jgi:PAS domain S-box-containing protein
VLDQRTSVGRSAFSSALPVLVLVVGATSSLLAWGWFRHLEGVPNQSHTVAPLAVLLGGLLATGLMVALLRSLQGRAAQVERQVAERTNELRSANEGLEAEISRRMEAERTLAAYRDDLERQVRERTAELEYATNHLRTIVDSEPECVKILNHRGELLEMNPAGLAMIEADSFDEVRGLAVYRLIAPEDRPAFVELNKRVMAGESGTLEFELHGLNGSIRRLETHAVPLFTVEGEPPLHLAVTRDVTERWVADRERAALEVQLRNSLRLKSVGVLAGGIAHDFNNLLQVIIGNVEVALGREGDVRGPLEATRTAATEAAKLCDQMLTYAGESRPDVRPVSMPLVVRSMLELLDASHPKKVTLDVEMDEDTIAIDGDDIQLGQVVMNLVTNAFDAIGDEQGTVQVTVGASDFAEFPTGGMWFDAEPAAGRYVMLEVADTGAGIEAAALDHIFDPFYTTKFAGRGLGLSSSLGIVLNHGGHLHVVSRVGRGTTFTVLFPVSAEAPAPREDSGVTSEGLFNGTILVVDDDRQILELSCRLLESLDLEVISANDGEEAVRVFADHVDDIDMVLLDVAMPKLDGNETCRALRSLRPGLPVVFCSGYAVDVASEHMAGDAFTGFLHKPYRRSDVIAVLTEAQRVLTT